MTVYHINFSTGKQKYVSNRREPFPEASPRKHQQKVRDTGRKILLTIGSIYQNNKQNGNNKTPNPREEEDSSTQAKEEEVW